MVTPGRAKPVVVATVLDPKDYRRVRRALLEFGDRIHPAVNSGFNRAMYLFRRDWIDRLKGKYAGKKNRSNAFKNAKFWEYIKSRSKTVDGAKASFGTRSKVAAIHETGGIVRPKKGRFLVIPTSEALTGSGRLKKGHRRPGTLRRKIRGDSPGSRAYRYRYVARGFEGGTPGLYTRSKKNPVRVFHLLKRVKIQPTLGLEDAWVRALPITSKRFAERFESRLRKLVREWNAGRSGAA